MGADIFPLPAGEGLHPLVIVGHHLALALRGIGMRDGRIAAEQKSQQQRW